MDLADATGAWTEVGRLIHSDEITRFEFAGSYWENVHRPVLGQVFEERGPAWTPSQRVALPTWFSHLLPEGYMRAAVAAAVGVDANREYFLLVRLGEADLPGAVRVTVPDEGPDGYNSLPELAHSASDEDNPLLKFSLAGIQPKFSVIRIEGQKGLTIPAHGQAGDWIVKLSDHRPGYDGVPDAEFACLQLAAAIGISVPPADLVATDRVDGLPGWARGGSALATKRFDRTPGGRIHAEMLAQVLDIPNSDARHKYVRANFETIASVVGELCGPGSVLEVVDRLVLNVLVGNGDAHLKNWAVVYPDGQNPALSPAYDIVPTVLYLPDDDLGLKLNNSRRFDDVTVRSFDRLAQRSGWDTATVRNRVRDTVAAVVAEWDILRPFLSSDRLQQLTQRRDSLPLLQTARVHQGRGVP